MISDTPCPIHQFYNSALPKNYIQMIPSHHFPVQATISSSLFAHQQSINTATLSFLNSTPSSGFTSHQSKHPSPFHSQILSSAFPLTHSTSMSSLPFLKHAKHHPTLGPFFPLLGMLLPKISAWLTSFLP